jgi:hypothetical protein
MPQGVARFALSHKGIEKRSSSRQQGQVIDVLLLPSAPAPVSGGGTTGLYFWRIIPEP